MRFVTLFRRAALPLLPLLTACTAVTTATETAAPAARSTSTPTSVGSDADRRAIYEANSPAAPAGGRRRPAAVPDATPNTLRLGEQAADINRRKRPESLNTNDPNLSAPETRLRRLGQSPTDTVRRVP